MGRSVGWLRENMARSSDEEMNALMVKDVADMTDMVIDGEGGDVSMVS